MRRFTIFLAVIFTMIIGVVSAPQATEKKIIMNGSSSFTGAIILNMTGEQMAQLTPFMDYYTTSSGGGLKALLDGQADIAMVSFAKDALPDRKELKDREGLFEALSYHLIGETEVQIIVSQNSPLQSITLEQLQKIMLKQVSDWSELGMDDLGEIRVMAGHRSSGTFATAEKKILKGDKVNDDVMTYLQTGLQVPVVVSQLPNVLGLTNSAVPEAVRSGTRILPVIGLEAVQSLGLITYKKTETDQVMAVVDKMKELTAHMRHQQEAPTTTQPQNEVMTKDNPDDGDKI